MSHVRGAGGLISLGQLGGEKCWHHPILISKSHRGLPRDHVWDMRAGDEPRMTPRVWPAPVDNEIGSPGEELDLGAQASIWNCRVGSQRQDSGQETEVRDHQGIAHIESRTLDEIGESVGEKGVQTALGRASGQGQ